MRRSAERAGDVTRQRAGPTVAVVILTFNEEENLPQALASVLQRASEVIVVDSYSTDRTIDVVKAVGGDRVRTFQHPFKDYSSQWNWVLNAVPVSAEWTLKLDADERVPEEFWRELERTLPECSKDVGGVYFRRDFFFMGKKLRWGGTRGNFDLRLWRTGRARFEARAVNEHVVVSGATTRLSGAVEHRDSRSLGDWLRKHERYASLEAREILNDNVNGEVQPRVLGRPDEVRVWFRQLFHSLPGRSFLYFCYRAFVRLGFLDGRVGLRYWFLHTTYMNWITWKVEEARRTGRLPEVAWPARGNPDPRAIQG
jgi:glycosyltransferase involved in cell wall biosynthesis